MNEDKKDPVIEKLRHRLYEVEERIDDCRYMRDQQKWLIENAHVLDPAVHYDELFRELTDLDSDFRELCRERDVLCECLNAFLGRERTVRS